MKYLILPTAEANKINNDTAISRGAKWENAKVWADSPSQDGLLTALHIPDDEITNEMDCIDELPDEFKIEPNLDVEIKDNESRDL